MRTKLALSVLKEEKKASGLLSLAAEKRFMIPGKVDSPPPRTQLYRVTRVLLTQ
jgi:hypothetical protein